MESMEREFQRDFERIGNGSVFRLEPQPTDGGERIQVGRIPHDDDFFGSIDRELQQEDQNEPAQRNSSSQAAAAAGPQQQNAATTAKPQPATAQNASPSTYAASPAGPAPGETNAPAAPAPADEPAAGEWFQSFQFSTSTVSRNNGERATLTRRAYRDSEGRDYMQEEKSNGRKRLKLESRRRNGQVVSETRDLQDDDDVGVDETAAMIADFERQWEDSFFGHRSRAALSSS